MKSTDPREQEIHSLAQQLRDCRELLNQTNQELAETGNERATLATENEALRVERDGLAAFASKFRQLMSDIAVEIDTADEWECDPIPNDLWKLNREAPSQSLAHIRAAGAREALERAMEPKVFSGTVVRVDALQAVISEMESDNE